MDDEFCADNILILGELRKKNAFIFVITDCLHKCPKEQIDVYVEIASLGIFTGALAILPI